MVNIALDGQARAAALLRGETVAAFAAPFRIGLGVAVDDAGLVGEPPAANGYARQTFTFGGSGAALNNSNAISFGPFTADLGDVSAFMIFDNAGQRMWWGWLSQAVQLSTGATRSFAIGDITGTID